MAQTAATQTSEFGGFLSPERAANYFEQIALSIQLGVCDGQVRSRFGALALIGLEAGNRNRDDAEHDVIGGPIRWVAFVRVLDADGRVDPALAIGEHRAGFCFADCRCARPKARKALASHRYELRLSRRLAGLIELAAWIRRLRRRPTCELTEGHARGPERLLGEDE